MLINTKYAFLDVCVIAKLMLYKAYYLMNPWWLDVKNNDKEATMSGPNCPSEYFSADL